jgi:hypothetical protein
MPREVTVTPSFSPILISGLPATKLFRTILPAQAQEVIRHHTISSHGWFAESQRVRDHGKFHGIQRLNRNLPLM